MKGLTDFADWLSPMLVKELRQGVRSRVFVYTLLFLQGSLLLLAIHGLLAADAQQNTDDSTVIFWIIAGVFLILFLPLSGFNAIGNERTSNTLELIFLTRLGTRRIVIGKWLAIVAQTNLLVFTVLPYLVLRYFLGGVDLWKELLTLGWMLIGSAVLSAVTVGFSTLPPVFASILRVAGLFAGMFVLAGGVMSRLSRGTMSLTGSFAGTWKEGIAAMIGAIFLILLMLEFGSARVAPPAENHTSPLRFIGLGAIAAGIILDHALFHSEPEYVFAGFIFALPVLLFALCESPRMIASLYRPFVRRGFLGKCAGRLFYPGWPSATWYVLTAVLALGLTLYFGEPAHNRKDALSFVIAITGIAGTLLFPAALMRLLGRRLRHPWVLYIGIQALFGLLHAFAAVLQEFKRIDIHPILDAIPTCALLNAYSEGFHDIFLQLFLVGATTSLSIIVLLWQSRSPWMEIRALEKKADGMKDVPREPGPSVPAASAAAS